MNAPLLDVRQVSRVYDVRMGRRLLGSKAQLKAVDGVSFLLETSETLGIVGESGCGKSTTAKLVLGLIPASSGSVTFEGQPVTATRDAKWRALRRRMQMVYQDPLGALDRRLTVGAQVREPLDIGAVGLRSERRERALALFDAVGLPRAAFDRYPHELSGGQRQRVVLARALTLEPTLLVCDEPVSSLDVSIQAQVINLLLDLQQRLGIAMLFISHDLKVVRQVADRVAVMYLGRIVETGPPDELFHAPSHPYTQALVSSVPSPHARGRKRVVLAGDPPSPMDVPRGCAFRPRCPLAVEQCRSERPELSPQGTGRTVACHRAGEAITIATGGGYSSILSPS
jgi:peptide/nickel transport system ATP-binding protein